MRPVYKVSPLREGTPLCRSNFDLSDLMEATESLVFDFEEGETHHGTPKLTPAEELAAADTVEQLNWLLEPSSDVEKLLKLHVRVARECAPNHQIDPATLSRALERAGYACKLHSPPANKLRGLRHQFLTVCLPDGGDRGSSAYVVDPHFRDSFEVAHPTPRYAAVLAGLDQEIVATQACLRRAVAILSRELARSFTDQGSPVPPWRTQSALLSKWELQKSAAGCGEPLLGARGLEAGGQGGQGGSAEHAAAPFGRVS